MDFLGIGIVKLDKDTVTLIAAIAGTAFGLVGMVLGIINSWRAISRDRVKLLIRPVWILFANESHSLGIEIINRSYLPVTVTQVGFTLRNSDKIFIFIPMRGTCQLPQRMEPRTSFTAIAPFGTENEPTMRDVRYAFAKTACECRFFGTNRALRGVIKKARSTPPPEAEETEENE